MRNNMTKSDNTIVTIGDINYLWGIFMLIASARKAGMKEPFLVGCKSFTPEAKHILAQLGGVSCVDIEGISRSLTCYKPFVMLKAETEFVTWADSDAFFTGNVSGILKPDPPEGIHFRMRKPSEKPGLAWRHSFGGIETEVPHQVLETWRKDVRDVAGASFDTPRFKTTGSACFCSLSLKLHRHFLEIWHELQMKVLPEKDIGVTDRSLKIYPQLDESTLNACLAFLPNAPMPLPVFKMDKKRERLFVHFIAQPKPWQGWTKHAFRFFDDYVAVLDWAVAEGYAFPSPIPPYLKASNKRIMKFLIPWMTLKPKIMKKLKMIVNPS